MDFGMTPRRPISCVPAMVQNLTCLKPHVTNFVSESGRNLTTKMACLLPVAWATLDPKKINRQQDDMDDKDVTAIHNQGTHI